VTSKQGSNKINHLYYTIPGCLVFITVVFSFVASSLSNKQAGIESYADINATHSHGTKEHSHNHDHAHTHDQHNKGTYDPKTGLTIGLDNRSVGGYQTALVKIDGTVFNLDIADTAQTRTLGLSNRETLAQQNGMLFFYENKAQHGIWMKDMNFAIDILWVNKDAQVVHTETNVSPETFPEVFRSPIPSHYVIELPAGTWQTDSIISW